MSPTDFIFFLKWYVLLLVTGMVFLPITLLIFSRFLDKGYVFAKTIGIIGISYLLFILVTIHLFSFTMLSSYLVFFILVIGNILLFWKKKEHLRVLFKQSWIFFLLEEILFAISLWFWTYIRAHQPNINGLEKFMDFGFINSILRSTYFPPKDMWLPPYPINYYYFGHMVTAVLTRLTNIPSNITFNLMLGTIFGFCFVSSFSIGLNLLYVFAKSKGMKFSWKTAMRSIVGSILIAYLVTLSGNLHILYAFYKPYINEQPVPLWQLPFLPQTFPNNYWYPNATRFIYHTIHEFPSYSFVVSDLHGHVLDIPFVLLTLAVFFSLLLQVEISEKKQQIKKNNFVNLLYGRYLRLNENFKLKIENLLLVSFLLAVMYMTNAWDALIYLIFACFFIFYITIRYAEKNATRLELFKRFAFSIIIVGFGFSVFSLPFSFFFKPLQIAGGIGLVCPPTFLIKLGHIGRFVFEADHCQRSPFWQLMTLYGFFYFWVMSFIVFFFIKQSKNDRTVSPSDVFVFFLIVVSTLLIILPEFVYLKDIYATYFRANTMFKLVYQSFIMLSFVSGYSIIRLFSQTSLKEKFFLSPYVLIGCVFLMLVGLYPYFAINSYYDNMKTYQGLNGTTYLSSSYPTDAPAITWINNNIKGQPVILEAQGDSYTDYARVSANTGLLTVLGWPVHEWLWRGTYDVASPRIADIQTMYETQDKGLTKDLLLKYNVRYIFIGDLERKKYKLSDQKFAEMGKVVYQNGLTKIYQLYL